MQLGIDASNLRAGGGITHLVELLRAVEPGAYGFSSVIVWSSLATLRQIEDRHWLVKKHSPLLEKGLAWRTAWQRLHLSEAARAAGCDVLFVPGGTYTGDYHPVVTMSRNLLPFEWREMRRYGLSLKAMRLATLRLAQSRTLRRADGVIFLSNYARTAVLRKIRSTRGTAVVIPHGVSGSFSLPPRRQRAIAECSPGNPFRIVYVSIVDLYKHQWHAADAVARLRQSGVPVVLELIGPAYAPALAKLERTLARVDPRGDYVHYVGPLSHEEMRQRYSVADLCLFASSCENMPNIVLEAMSAGLPIVCSNRGPMPEVLKHGGIYCDPENPAAIASAIRDLVESPHLRARLALASFQLAQQFSWHRCAAETFVFIRDVAMGAPARSPQASVVA